MSGIKDYSTTAASNTALFPEGMAPSSVNDNLRQMQADLRSWYEDAQWVNLGHTPTRTGNTTFTVSGDKTADYTTGRRIKCSDSATIYGTIVSSSYSAPNTTVTIHSDSGNLSASLSAVFLSIQTPTNVSMHANYGRKGSDIASASTVDLSTATGDFVDVTGTTTITSLGTMAAGIHKTIRFTGALTLTHNATSLILPGTANITTAANDRAIFRSLGSGNWVCIAYVKADGTAIVTTSPFSKGADIASASTTDLSTATGDFVDITGTTTITAFGTVAAGGARTLRFTGALTLTHNSTSLILPGAANITTANGDTAIFRSLGSGNWVCIAYSKATGKAVIESFSTAAAQSDQETGSSTTTIVTPGRQQFHPSAAKAWCYVTYSGGTPSATASYNVSSITDTGVGDATINLTTSFSSSNYAVIGSKSGIANLAYDLGVTITNSSSYLVTTFNDSAAKADLNSFTAAFGDQ